MIVSVRGPCGSGKSTLVKRITKEYHDSFKNYRHGRKKPWSVVHTMKGRPPLYVPGHYEIECGGLDTVKETALSAAYEDMKDAVIGGAHVLCEGATTWDSANNLLDLSKYVDTRIAFLTTTVEECERGLRAKKPDITPHRLFELMRRGRVMRDFDWLVSHGVEAYCLDREKLFDLVMEWLS